MDFPRLEMAKVDKTLKVGATFTIQDDPPPPTAAKGDIVLCVLVVVSGSYMCG